MLGQPGMMGPPGDLEDSCSAPYPDLRVTLLCVCVCVWNVLLYLVQERPYGLRLDSAGYLAQQR